MTDTSKQLPFGARLLEAYRSRYWPTPMITYAQVQRLKVADREESIRILSSRFPPFGWLTARFLRKGEPEDIVARQRRWEFVIVTLLVVTIFWP
ncbi:MAG: hypothetical protein R3F17_04870 [Planctomycetota bacterium]